MDHDVHKHHNGHHGVGTTGGTIDDFWRSERPYLQAMASRMLHGRADSEDIVQEAFGRLARADLGAIDDVRGWLMVVVRRLCLDDINSAHTRREFAPGWPSEGAVEAGVESPRGASVDPADRVTLDDEVSLALAIVLDRLSPAERTAFVLHDVFGFPFDAVGEIVGRTPAACRQLASRARTSIRAGEHSGDQRAGIEVTQHRVLTERFIAACAGGDITELMSLLDPDVVGEASLLGHGPISRVEGRPAVAKRILEMFGPRTQRLLIPVPIDDSPGVVALQGGSLLGVFRLDESAGVVRHIKGMIRLPR